MGLCNCKGDNLKMSISIIFFHLPQTCEKLFIYWWFGYGREIFIFHISSIIIPYEGRLSFLITWYYCKITWHYLKISGTYHSLRWSYRLVRIVPYPSKRLSEQLEETIWTVQRDYSNNSKVTPECGRYMEVEFLLP